jgi:site-specific recombinase XerD
MVAELPESKGNRFSRFFNTVEEDVSLSKAKYDAAVKQLTCIHENRKYSSSIRKSDLQAVRNFRVFMDANSFAYSNDLALEWLELQRSKWPQAKYWAFRRVLLSIHEILCTGTLSTRSFSIREPKYTLPDWGGDILSKYLHEREREGCARSTLDMIRNSCSRFLTFLDKRGIVSESGITPEVIKDFQAWDNHSTVEGKNAYAIKIRVSLGFLPERGWCLRHLNLQCPQKWLRIPPL